MSEYDFAEYDLPDGGMKPHGLPVRFESLTITADDDPLDLAPGNRLVPTLSSSLAGLLDPVRAAARQLYGKAKKSPRAKRRRLFVGIEGLVDQGELLLILGPSSADTSTLLRALSMPPDLEVSETSTLDFGLVEASKVRRTPTLRKRHDLSWRSEVVYMDEHDVHFAGLSMNSGMMPSSRSKTPKTVSSDNTRLSWASTQLHRLAWSLGLAHAVDTPVGSALVRGLSGGERKRASILEALLARPSVLLLDCPINGLDSSTAASVLNLLRKWAREGKKSVLVTTPHISDNLYATFDKVLVLNSSGRQVYFGKAHEAQSYFENLGMGYQRRDDVGEGIAEFILDCVQTPGHQTKLYKSWLVSESRRTLLRSFDEYSTRYAWKTCAGPLLAAIQEEKAKYTPKHSHYTSSFLAQVALLTRRQYALIWSERSTYITKTTVNILLSILVGTLFFRLPQTTNAAFTRGSVLLLSIMFNAYLSLAELGKAIEGRDIVKRQGDWGFFGASALALARVAGDLPLIGVQVLLFGTVTYLLAGLQLTASKFFTYILFVYATALNLSSVFRMFAAFSPTFEVAIRYCGLTLNVLVVVAGYFIPTPSMGPVPKWIHYVLDPISYAYEAVLANEFHDLELACSPEHIVPSGPMYTSPLHQTCTLPGSVPGSLVVSGDAYLAVVYDFHYGKRWENLGIMVAQAVVFLIIGIIATDFLNFAPQGKMRLWARTKAVRDKFGVKTVLGLRRERRVSTGYEDMEADGTQSEVSEEAGSDSSFDPNESDEALAQSTGMNGNTVRVSGSTLAWKKLSLWVNTKTDTRKLLDQITGYVEPGRLTCLLGPSGAGKSTLLNALAGRSGDAIISGEILVDGKKPDNNFYRMTGYVEQFDLFDERATVREALEFSAVMRQDPAIPTAARLAYVDVVLRLLGIVHLQDAVIGTPACGLGIENRKLLSIAVEVVSKPAILFCDEPTTGLDSKSALKVITVLNKLAKTGLAVLATIHQPSAETFSTFDNVLLLQRGGKEIYFGAAADAASVFKTVATFEAGSNPADTLLEVASVGMTSGTATPRSPAVDAVEEDLSALWRESRFAKRLDADVQRLSAAPQQSAAPRAPVNPWTQAAYLTTRLSRHLFRDPSFSYTKLFTSVFVAFVIGISFLQLDNTIQGFQNRMFAIFLVLFIPPVFMNLMIFKMTALRSVWLARERPSQSYGPFAFCTSLVVSEIPYSLCCASIFFAIWYPMVGFPSDSGTVAFTFGMVQIFFFFQSTWAMWITALAPTLGVIANLLPFFLVAMECFNGALMPLAQMPVYWKWLYYASPFQWYVRAVMANVMHGLPIECSSSELVKFSPPSGQSCIEYAGDYLATHAGYLVDEAATAVCSFCRLSSGDDFLATLSIQHSDRWGAFAILAAFTVSNVGLVYFFTFFPPATIVKNLVPDGKQRRAIIEVLEEEVEPDEAIRLAEAATLGGAAI